jgi:hypothetical protein
MQHEPLIPHNIIRPAFPPSPSRGRDSHLPERGFSEGTTVVGEKKAVVDGQFQCEGVKTWWGPASGVVCPGWTDA